MMQYQRQCFVKIRENICRRICKCCSIWFMCELHAHKVTGAEYYFFLEKSRCLRRLRPTAELVAREISPSTIHSSNTPQCVLNRFFIGYVKEAKCDTANKKFCRNSRSIRGVRQADILLHLQARLLWLNQVNFYHFLHIRNSIWFSRWLWKSIAMFSKLTDPVIKVTGMNIVLFTPDCSPLK